MVALQTSSFANATQNRGVERRQAAGMEVEFIVDGGAYCTLSPVVLSRARFTRPSVSLSNVRIKSSLSHQRSPHGAFRGFGRRKVFSRWSDNSIKCRDARVTPEQFRRRNFIKRTDDRYQPGIRER